MAVPIEAAVERLIEARVTHRRVAPLSETYGDFPLAEAYEIQDALRAGLERRGQRPIGWKLAATAPVGQAIIGVSEPGCGFLLAHRYESGDKLSAAGFVDLRLEAEIAFQIGTRLTGPGVTAESARAAVKGLLPAFEVLDFVYSGTPRAGDYYANNIHGEGVVLGGPRCR